ncbi:ankyrin and armadillo repeat-containing protein [Chiloscyllium plagiosum]|uniref:ankyrin and armadillo repeat-containing protein n=1 Tax=Chiloscyllium plagiosum TaxID=36176 RepID=UPI001CB887A0|nr:ankyrin and armadillo repeat-containing protein [Chiloscyllium plagiosum]
MAGQMSASAVLGKYNLSDLQELLAITTCTWLQPTNEFHLPVEYPTGLASQMKDFSHSNAIILTPMVPDAPLNYKEVQQILRELVMGIYILNQVPTIYLDGNYDCSTTCVLSPAYRDTLIGQILINVDYTMKALWHGAYMPTEKRKRFSEVWRANLEINVDGTSKLGADIPSEFLRAGLIDISTDPDFTGIYSTDVYLDPSYDPNNCAEITLFMQHVNNILLQINPYITYVRQHQNVFMCDATYTLSNAIKLTEEEIDLVAYQRLQQRLIIQQKLVENYLERKAEIHRNIAYLKLIAFLIPFLIALRGKKKVPDLSRILPPFSDDKLKTEREFPPLLLGPNFKCKHFLYNTNEYFHLHGGIEFDIGTPGIEDLPEHIKANFTDIQTQAMYHLKQLFKPDMLLRGQYTIPTMKFEGKSYYAIAIELESIFLTVQKSKWWKIIHDVIPLLKSDKLPLNGTQLNEQLKKKFGHKQTLKCKDLAIGLTAATKSGLAAVFYTYCQQNPISQLGVVDGSGYALIHHAAIHNHVSIICQLTAIHLKINQRCTDYLFNMGKLEKPSGLFMSPTALHMAAKCGSLGSLTCLLALRADVTKVDKRGWTAIHFAAFYDNVSCIRALYRKDPKFLELETSAQYNSTPLLLASMAGAFDSLQYLLSLGANLTTLDSENNNVIHLAALYSHTEILKYIIEQNIPELPVWELLTEMMKSKEYKKQEMGVRSLEVLCVTDKQYWKAIHSAGSIPALVDLLHSKYETLQCIAAAVLCNLSSYPEVCQSIIDYNIIPVLIELLHSKQPELQSRCSVILYDIALIDDNASLIASLGAIPPLVRILNSEVEDVLINATRCIRILCTNNPVNQTLVANEGAIPLLVELLSVTSEALQGDASVALAEVARGHTMNQNAIVAEGAVVALVNILSGRKIRMQMKAIKAVEVLADGNAAVQKEFLKVSTDKHIMKLLKVFEIEIREQAATAFWALAGQTLTQRKKMAKDIGYSLVIDLLLSSSDKMHNVACQALIALSECNKEQQDNICAKNGISPLVRLLRSSTISLRTLLSAIAALGTMCVGVAHQNNPISQQKITEGGGMDVLLYLLFSTNSPEVQVEVIYSLACIVLGNNELQKLLMEKKGFNVKIALNHFNTTDKNICSRAASALALFAINNPKLLDLIRACGGVQMLVFQKLLQSSEELDQVNAAFQMIILAKVIVGMDEVTLSATGIITLVNLLKSKKASTVIVVGRLLSSLTQIREGISDAIITMGAVEILCTHLYAEREQVRDSCATALGYLSFNRTGHRHLLKECRNQPELFDLLIANICKDGKISKEFTDEFKLQKLLGLPIERLELSEGHLSVVQPEQKVRLKTASCPQEQKKTMTSRLKSAPK